jgi:hypothetical protein
MRKLLLGLLLFLTCNSQCFAYGAVALGDIGGNLQWIAVTDERTATDARSAALKECMEMGLSQCRVYAVAVSPAGFTDYAVDEDIDEARRNAIATCSANRQSACKELATWWDVTPTDEPSATPDAPSETEFRFIPGFPRGIELLVSVTYTAEAIMLTLFLWILASMISTTSVDVLKRRIAISAWIALPSVPAAIGWVIPSNYGTLMLNIFAALFLWADVYTALIVGVGYRRALSVRSRSLFILSLPLATLVFTVVSFGAGKLTPSRPTTGSKPARPRCCRPIISTSPSRCRKS